jgi:hypothetical protein
MCSGPVGLGAILTRITRSSPVGIVIGYRS